MKRHSATPILFALIFCCFLSVSGQSAKNDELKIQSLINSANKNLKGKTYRVKMTSENYKNTDNPATYSFTTIISEYVSNDLHRITTAKNTEQDIIREEEIFIGQRKYTKYNDEEWKDTSFEIRESAGNGAGASKNPDISFVIVGKYIGKELIYNQNADIYETKKTTQFKVKDREITIVITERYWFSEDGLFLKIETEPEYDSKISSHTIWEYEYDPNIKIEAPIN